MQYIIQAPMNLNADITLPASKSISNRALIISALAAVASGTKPLLPENLSDCDDTDVIVSALQNMPDTIDIGAAGTAMRFMTAYLSVTEGTHILTGTERMKHRPIKILVDALRQLGAKIEYLGEEGYPPLRIHGRKLTGGKLDIRGDVSSQYISALLMIGPMLEKGLLLHLQGTIASRPYVDLTLCTMRDYSADAEWRGVDSIYVAPKPYSPTPYYVESDWSAASYWYEMMALYSSEDSKVVLHGLMDGSRQGDSALKYMFSLMGVKTTFATDAKLVPTDVTLQIKGKRLPRMDYDFTNQPDLAQTVIATCAATDLKFNFRGLASLKIKETDRITAMKIELRKLGFVLYDYNDSEMRWDGDRCDRDENVEIDTYQDHRMAMSIAPMSIILGDIRINNPEVVSKSYPHFWSDLRKAGFIITEISQC